MSAAATIGASNALVALGVALRQAEYAFTTITPASHARVLARPGAPLATDLADIFGWSKPFLPATIPPRLLALMAEAGVLNDDGDVLRSRVRASTLDSDLLFHSAYPTSAADAVFFGPDTYRFVRAMHTELDTHTRPITRAVEVCCGAGPAAIAVARRFPDASVIAADINQAALAATEVNARLAGLDNISVAHSDLLKDLDGDFDLITANPPYLLDPAQRAYRHGGGELGAGLSLDIVHAAIERLRPGGLVLLYTGVAIVRGHDPFRAAAGAALQQAGLSWDYCEIDPDVFGEELETEAYAGTDRIAAVMLHAVKE